MRNYIIHRLLLAIPTLIGITLLIFLAMRVLPGDPLRSIEGAGKIVILTDEQLASARHTLGLDKPLYLQYLSWMRDVLKGDLGYSFFRSHEPIREIIQRRGIVTAQIAFIAVALSWIIGLPVGIIAATKRNSIADFVSRFLITLGMSIPSFWLGLTFILFTVIFFSWRPPIMIVWIWDDPWRSLQQTVPAAVVFSIGGSAVIARMSRATLLEVLGDDYIRTARAKGLSQKVVLVRHALRNAILPVITLSGLQLAGILGGTVAVERAFGIPGLGSALVEAITDRDWMVIQNLVLIFGVTYLLFNLLIDLSYAWIDPRIRYGRHQ